MGRRCCFGVCNSDARYYYKPHMRGVWFIPFPKPWLDLEKCERWIKACGRKHFSPSDVTKNTYICSKHFIGGNGPTLLDPDPIFYGKKEIVLQLSCRDRSNSNPLIETVPEVTEPLKKRLKIEQSSLKPEEKETDSIGSKEHDYSIKVFSSKSVSESLSDNSTEELIINYPIKTIDVGTQYDRSTTLRDKGSQHENPLGPTVNYHKQVQCSLSKKKDAEIQCDLIKERLLCKNTDPSKLDGQLDMTESEIHSCYEQFKMILSEATCKNKTAVFLLDQILRFNGESHAYPPLVIKSCLEIYKKNRNVYYTMRKLFNLPAGATLLSYDGTEEPVPEVKRRSFTKCLVKDEGDFS